MAPLSKRVAVISDVHANRHALDAVLAAIEVSGADEVWCLGDLVGYGPQPNECCRAVAARAELSLAGNHDLVVLGSLPIHDFAGDAAHLHERQSAGALHAAAEHRRGEKKVRTELAPQIVEELRSARVDAFYLVPA